MRRSRRSVGRGNTGSNQPAVQISTYGTAAGAITISQGMRFVGGRKRGAVVARRAASAGKGGGVMRGEMPSVSAFSRTTPKITTKGATDTTGGERGSALGRPRKRACLGGGTPSSEPLISALQPPPLLGTRDLLGPCARMPCLGRTRQPYSTGWTTVTTSQRPLTSGLSLVARERSALLMRGK